MSEFYAGMGLVNLHFTEFSPPAGAMHNLRMCSHALQLSITFIYTQRLSAISLRNKVVGTFNNNCEMSADSTFDLVMAL